MAAAFAKLLRGGRSGGSSQALLPASCRRGPQEGRAGLLLPRPGATAPASPAALASGLMGRRMCTVRSSSPSPLEVLRKKYVHIPGPVRFVPYDSKFVILDRAKKLDSIRFRMQEIRKRLKYLAALIIVMGAAGVGLLVSQHRQSKANQESATELKMAVEQVEAELSDLEMRIRKMVQDLS